LIVFQLVAGETILDLGSDGLRPAKGQLWEFLISTNDSHYGGTKAARFDREARKVILTEPELIVLREEDAQKT